MPGSDPVTARINHRLTPDYLLQLDSLALDEHGDMDMQIIPSRTNQAVKGDAEARGGWDTPIRILGWFWGLGCESGHLGHAFSAQDVRVSALSVIKAADVASPVIMTLCKKAELLSLAHLRCYKSGGGSSGSIEYFSLKLERGSIRHHYFYTSPRLHQVCEFFEVSAQKITVTTAKQLATGARGPDVTADVDVGAR